MSWPCSNCSGETAAKILFDVIELAVNAHRGDVVLKAIECSRHNDSFGGTLTLGQHCTFAIDARDAASVFDWVACIEALEHIDTGGGGVVAAAEPPVAEATAEKQPGRRPPLARGKKKRPAEPRRKKPDPRAKKSTKKRK